jgi:hypothetical protein
MVQLLGCPSVDSNSDSNATGYEAVPTNDPLAEPPKNKGFRVSAVTAPAPEKRKVAGSIPALATPETAGETACELRLCDSALFYLIARELPLVRRFSLGLPTDVARVLHDTPWRRDPAVCIRRRGPEAGRHAADRQSLDRRRLWREILTAGIGAFRPQPHSVYSERGVARAVVVL